MAIPKIQKHDINEALKYIDEKGVPAQHTSTKYVLVNEKGKNYPPMYVVAVADHIANGTEISTEGFNAVEAKNFLEARGFNIETKLQEKFELYITAESVESTDERFTMNNLGLGDNYKPLEAYFLTADGEIIRRAHNKSEYKISNQTLPRIACQLFETQISALPAEEREHFPVCQYRLNDDPICGIYPTAEELKAARMTTSYEYLTYRHNDTQFVFYCWNIFSTIIFVRECLRRFGQPGDRFVLIYREKTDKEKKKPSPEAPHEPEPDETSAGTLSPYSSMLIEAKNIILHGAPGTGKTYLAKQIAADIVSDGYYDDFTELSDEQKSRVGFVQFHPSYDYTDFVEGLRPITNGDSSMGFKLRDGVFMEFVKCARENYENSQKSTETLEKELSAQDAMADFFTSIEFGTDIFMTAGGREFTITSVDRAHINISIPGNAIINTISLRADDIKKMLESEQKFEKAKDLTPFLGRSKYTQQSYSYELAVYNAIKAKKSTFSKRIEKQEELKKYIFIIDEINRGEISKIFGELFFSIDPGYRGENGAVSTQYANLHDNPDEKFYIPENVYIIGTMNDIDRSVDSFDFAMRRRFRFVEIKADESLEMLESLGDEGLKDEAIERMARLNKEIAKTEDLNENYQIGAAYFLKLKELGFDKLWEDYLEPLLQEYVRGMGDEKSIMEQFAKAYGYEGGTDDN